MQKKKDELKSAKTVPRGTWELADHIGIKKGNTKQFGTTRRSLGADSRQYEEWRRYVHEHFDEIAAATELQLAQDEDEKLEQVQIRTCSDRLSRLLREDLRPEMLEIFYDRIESTAMRVTNDISELGAIVRATIFKYVTMDRKSFFPAVAGCTGSGYTRQEISRQ